MIVTEKGTFGFSPVINFKLILTLPVFRPCTNPFQTNTVTTLVAFIKKKNMYPSSTYWHTNSVMAERYFTMTSYFISYQYNFSFPSFNFWSRFGTLLNPELNLPNHVLIFSLFKF